MGGAPVPLRRYGRTGGLRARPHPDLRGRGRLPQGDRRGQRRGGQGDVRVRGPGRPDPGAPSGGHRPDGPGLGPAPPAAAVEGLVRHARLPLRGAPGRSLPPAPPARCGGTRADRPRPRRRGPRPGRRILPLPRAHLVHVAPQLDGRRHLPAGLPRPSSADYLAERRDQLCDEHRDRLEANPLRALDCKRDACRRATDGAPGFVDHLCGPCRAHFARVRAGLDALGVGYELDHRLVRGFDYYTRTTFEFASDALESAQNGIGGGGTVRPAGRDAGRTPHAGHRLRHGDRTDPHGLRRRGHLRRRSAAARRVRRRHRRGDPRPRPHRGPARRRAVGRPRLRRPVDEGAVQSGRPFRGVVGAHRGSGRGSLGYGVTPSPCAAPGSSAPCRWPKSSEPCAPPSGTPPAAPRAGHHERTSSDRTSRPDAAPGGHLHAEPPVRDPADR